MKSIKLLLVGILALLIVSCSDILNVFDDEDPNELGGETDLALTKVGNEYGVDIKVNGDPLNVKTEAKIVENDKGIITLRIKINLDNLDELYKQYKDQIPENYRDAYQQYKDQIPDNYTDTNGNIDTKIKFKITSEGIQDYFHSKQDISKPFTIVKYADGVGTKYKFTTVAGKVVTRTITAKSNTDDFPMGPLLIKTTTIEEDSQDKDVSKVIYYTNHKFGLVHMKIYLKAGFEMDIDLTPWAVI